MCFRHSWLRRKALDWIYRVIRKEDEFTKYIDIGPVNKMINMLCVWYGHGCRTCYLRSLSKDL